MHVAAMRGKASRQTVQTLSCLDIGRMRVLRTIKKVEGEDRLSPYLKLIAQHS